MAQGSGVDSGADLAQHRVLEANPREYHSRTLRMLAGMLLCPRCHGIVNLNPGVDEIRERRVTPELVLHAACPRVSGGVTQSHMCRECSVRVPRSLFGFTVNIIDHIRTISTTYDAMIDVSEPFSFERTKVHPTRNHAQAIDDENTGRCTDSAHTHTHTHGTHIMLELHTPPANGMCGSAAALTFDEPCNNRPTHPLNSRINLVASPLLAYSSANAREESPTP